MDPSHNTPWFLRIDDGSIFEAANLDALKRWAAEGRVSPASAVSRDRATWQSAPEVPELDMVWQVALADGTPFGPLHIGAVLELMADGVIAAGSGLNNLRTGQALSLRQWMAAQDDRLTAALDQCDVLRTALSESTAQRDVGAAAAQAEAQAAGERVATLQRRVTELEKQLSARNAAVASAGQSQQSLTDERQAWDGERMALNERVASLDGEAASLRADRETLQGRAAALVLERDAAVASADQSQQSLTDERQAWDGERATLNERVAALDGEAASLRADRETLQGRAAALVSERDAAVALAGQSQRSLADERQAWDGERATLNERVAALDGELASLRAERETLQGRAAALISERDAASAAVGQWQDRLLQAARQAQDRELRVGRQERQIEGLTQRLRTVQGVLSALREAHALQTGAHVAAEALTRALRDRLAEAEASERRLREQWRVIEPRWKARQQQLDALAADRDQWRATAAGQEEAQHRAQRSDAALQTTRRALADQERMVADLQATVSQLHGEIKRLTADCAQLRKQQRTTRRETLILEPEVVRESTPPRPDGPRTAGPGNAGPGAGDAMERLRDLEAQAQAELARWQKQKRQERKTPGGIRQWFSKKDE